MMHQVIPPTAPVQSLTLTLTLLVNNTASYLSTHPSTSDEASSIESLLAQGKESGSGVSFSFDPTPPHPLLQHQLAEAMLPPLVVGDDGKGLVELSYGGGAACCRVPADLRAATRAAGSVAFEFLVTDG